MNRTSIYFLVALAWIIVVLKIFHPYLVPPSFVGDGERILKAGQDVQAFNSNSMGGFLLTPLTMITEFLGANVKTYGVVTSRSELLDSGINFFTANFVATFIFVSACFAYIALSTDKIEGVPSLYAILFGVGAVSLFVGNLAKDIVAVYLFIPGTLMLLGKKPGGYAIWIIGLIGASVMRPYYGLVAVCCLWMLMVPGILGLVIMVVGWVIVLVLAYNVPLLRALRIGYSWELAQSVPHSVILIPFSEESTQGFLGNRLLALLQILFPLRLLTSVGSLPFSPVIPFQIILDVAIWRSLRQKTDPLLRFCGGTMAGVTLVGAMFEPEFGSVIRHWAAYFGISFFVISGTFGGGGTRVRRSVPNAAQA